MDLLILQRLMQTLTLTLTTANLQNWLFHIIDSYQERAQTNNKSINISPDCLVVTDLSSLAAHPQRVTTQCL